MVNKCTKPTAGCQAPELAKQMPDKAAELTKMLQQWLTDMGAQMPTPNPKYDPVKEEQIFSLWRRRETQ